ncbi:MAG: DUF4386 family protein [Chloroflexota bacterium]
MKDHTLTKLGGFCSILVGISYVVIGINYMFLPGDQRPGVSTLDFLPSVAQDRTALMLEYWAFALGAVFALAAVLAISERIRSGNDGLVRWTSSLAFIGFAITAVTYFRLIAQVPRRAMMFVDGDVHLQNALAVTELDLYLDPQGWLGYGAIGLWVLVVSLLALRVNAIPKLLAYVGVAAAVLYWLVVAGYVLEMQVITALAAAVGGIILGPIWYIWNGILLRQASS